MTDFLGEGDGRCEFSYLRRCELRAEMTVATGSGDPAPYYYCIAHGERVLRADPGAHVVPE